jgi:cytochrome oxidase assembly protein ShyY1
MPPTKQEQRQQQYIEYEHLNMILAESLDSITKPKNNNFIITPGNPNISKNKHTKYARAWFGGVVETGAYHH